MAMGFTEGVALLKEGAGWVRWHFIQNLVHHCLQQLHRWMLSKSINHQVQHP